MSAASRLWERPFPLVVSGPSGSGKTTVARRLVSRLPGAWLSISATTRGPRRGEVHEKDYHFLSAEEFRRRLAEGNFLEWAVVHDHEYGTPRAPLEACLAGGRLPILPIDVQGGVQLKRGFPEAVLVFLVPPDLATLEARLRGRGSDSEDVIRRRLENAFGELERLWEYDYLVVNRDVDATVEEIAGIARCESRRIARLPREAGWDELFRRQNTLP